MFDYFHTLDREYSMNNNLGSEPAPDKKLAEPLLRIDQIGTSVAEGKQFGRLRQSVVAAMSRGVKEIELAVGPSEVTTGPASYGVQEREELRELARANQVRFTSTHVDPGAVGNVSGLGRGGFSESERQRQLNEIKQAIQFAADTALGGAVVVHTGEFPRIMSKFEGFSDAGKTMGINENVHHFFDKKTGERVLTVREDQVNYEFEYEDKKGNVTRDRALAATDDFGNPKLHRKPNGELSHYEKTWKNYEEEARQKGLSPDKADKLFFDATMNTEIEKAKSQEKDFEVRYQQEVVKAERLDFDLKSWKKQLSVSPDIDKSGLIDHIQNQLGRYRIETPRVLNPDHRVQTSETIKHLGQVEENLKKEVQSVQEALISSRRKVLEIEKKKDMIIPIQDYAKEKSVDSFATLGIEAMRATMHAKQEHPDEKVTEVFIAPENIFPEMGYGSHPSEMIELVNKSKAQMVKLLTQKELGEEGEDKRKNPYYVEGINEKKAAELADKHIKSTFDTEHLGMWKRYFQARPGETVEHYNQRFNDWYVEQVEELAKAKILGHIHLADGFGMGHANLPAGMGDLPIKDAVQALKEKGYKGTYESEGYGSPAEQETAAWSYFGSPIYSTGRTQQPFNSVYQNYFKGGSPYRSMTPPYYPSEEWKLWSEMPLE